MVYDGFDLTSVDSKICNYIANEVIWLLLSNYIIKKIIISMFL